MVPSDRDKKREKDREKVLPLFLFQSEKEGVSPPPEEESEGSKGPKGVEKRLARIIRFSRSPGKGLEGDLPGLSENGLNVLQKRYLRRDSRGNVVETPAEMFRRVAKAVAAADLHYSPDIDVKRVEEKFYRMMTSLEFLPNSPTLMNAGTELGQLSACFVLPVEDSLPGIFDSVKGAAMIHKSGGGTGFSFSRLRPKNDSVKTTRGVSSGPISFMRVFDSATETIKQGGRRRGANIGILRVDHPDIEEFIECKKEEGSFTNFNISVGITDAFMKGVEEDGDYDLINPKTGKPVTRRRSREIFSKIVEGAWRNGEPGVIFLDTINRLNPLPELGKIESTNPCGEQPLLPYESCNLGSINLSLFVKEDKTKPEVDWNRLKRVVHNAVHFLDNVIDINRYPIPIIEEKTKLTRKIGLGIMGWADFLIKLEIPYNSDDALGLGKKVMKFIRREARRMSEKIAEERGAFPAFPKSQWAKKGEKPLRNATTTTIAPTGSLSIIAGTSSGIEPLFALAYTRHILGGERLKEVHPIFLEVSKRRGFFSDELLEEIERSGSIQEADSLPADVKRIFLTALDIAPEWHIKTQAAFQRYVDNAVSKTLNFPNSATKEEVEKAMKEAHRLGCKGVTIYRDGSRDEQVLKIKGHASGKGVTTGGAREVIPRPRPNVLLGKTFRVTTGCGNLYITINIDSHGPFEIFVTMGKAGGCAASQLETTSRLISLALRTGIAPEEIFGQLEGIRCPSPAWSGGRMIKSCSDAIAFALKQYLSTEKMGAKGEEKDGLEAEFLMPAEDGEGESRPSTEQYPSRFCPECNGLLSNQEGCILCLSCGFTKCL